MKCEKHGVEMEYKGEGSFVGQDIWECHLCEAELFDSYEDDSAAADDDDQEPDSSGGWDGGDSPDDDDDGWDGGTHVVHRPSDDLDDVFSQLGQG